MKTFTVIFSETLYADYMAETQEAAEHAALEDFPERVIDSVECEGETLAPVVGRNQVYSVVTHEGSTRLAVPHGRRGWIGADGRHIEGKIIGFRKATQQEEKDWTDFVS